MKVQIKSVVHSYHYKGKRYLAGSILEVPDDKFVGYIMARVNDEPVKVEFSPVIVKEADAQINMPITAPAVVDSTVTVNTPVPVKKTKFKVKT